MSGSRPQQRIASLLEEVARQGSYEEILVTTGDGFPIASSSGDYVASENLAGVCALFDDVVERTERDLGMARVDELTVVDGRRGRLVIRPVPFVSDQRLFVVVRLNVRGTWRRNTNQLCRDLARLFSEAEV